VEIQTAKRPFPNQRPLQPAVQPIESIQAAQKLASSLDTGDSHGDRPEKSERREDYSGRAGRPAAGTKFIDQF